MYAHIILASASTASSKFETTIQQHIENQKQIQSDTIDCGNWVFSVCMILEDDLA